MWWSTKWTNSWSSNARKTQNFAKQVKYGCKVDVKIRKSGGSGAFIDPEDIIFTETENGENGRTI